MVVVVVVGRGVGAVGHTQHTWSCSLFVQTNVIINSCAKRFSGCIPYYTTLSMWQNLMQNRHNRYSSNNNTNY